MKTVQIQLFMMVIAILLFSGCTSTLYVTNYPGFFRDENTYGSIAVAEVKNDVHYGRYTRQLNADLVNGLYNNGYYYVKDYTNENFSDSELVSHLRENNVADLAVFSTLTNYGENYDQHTETKTQTREYYAVDEDGYTLYDANGDPIIDHTEEYEVEYTVYERTTFADMSVIVVDVKTGNNVYNSVRENSCYEEVYNPRNFSSKSSARWCALDRVVANEIYQIAPTFESISVRDDDVLEIYRYDQKKGWEEKTKFAADDKMKLVFWFPKAAYYNTFKFDIVYGDDDTELASSSIYWDGNTQSFEYDIASLVSASNGAEKFKIRLWNNKRVAFSKTIKVK